MSLCEYLGIEARIADDADGITDFSEFESIIPSPWVPPTNPIYKTWKIIWELDFAYRFLPKWFDISTITWTDWKSTTTWILFEILKKEFWDDKVYLSWNFDIPFSGTVLDILKSWKKRWHIVLESSSFMAYNVKEYESDYSIFTNFEDDHLNWHSWMFDYLNSKMNIFRRTGKACAINTQVLEKAYKSWIWDWSKEKFEEMFSLKNVRWFSAGYKTTKDRVEMPYVIVSWKKKYNMEDMKLQGQFNALNILSATIVTNEMWICSKRTNKYLSEIGWLPHRIEFVTEKSWVKIYDDSKSTSSQSLKAALWAFRWNVILIAWWSDKWDSFEWLEKALEKKVKFAALIWQTKETLAKKMIEANVPYVLAESMEEAVKNCWEQSEKWDTLLLSPGCASFWLFKDYLDRANKFREAIENL